MNLYAVKPIIKTLIAVLLIGCIFKVPYGYFQFIRIAGCIGLAYLAYFEFEANKMPTGVLCVAGAILLNPVYKIHFVRSLWNTIDLIMAALLIIWIVIDLVYLYNGKGVKKESI